MYKIRLIPISAAVVLSAAFLAANPAQATPLGATADMRLASETISPVTNIWWGRGFHRPFFFHHRPFFHHRAFFFHRRPFFAHRAFAFHRFHHCRWC